MDALVVSLFYGSHFVETQIQLPGPVPQDNMHESVSVASM